MASERMVGAVFGQQGFELLEDGLDEVWEKKVAARARVYSFVGKRRELPG